VDAPSGPGEAPPPIRGLFALLPGSDRKRSAAPYVYRLTYRGPEDPASGCVMTWEVLGGRLSYQIAIERDAAGDLHWHCTCADAVFRAEAEGRYCKHVRGFVEAARGLPALADGRAHGLRRGA
jgi:hypothetical protein